MQAFISNLSESHPIKVNDVVVLDTQPLGHADVITITDRAFRFEFAAGSKHFPGKMGKDRSPRTPKGKSPAKTPTKILTPKVCGQNLLR